MRSARRWPVLFSAAIAAVVAVLAVVLPLTLASASAVSGAGTRVGAHHPGMILAVGSSHAVCPGQGRGDAVPQPQFAAGACVAAEDTGLRSAGRFITNSAGDTLDTSRVTIPEGKFGYLLKNPGKAGVFSDSMGFDQQSLGTALRSHLTENFGNATESVPMTGDGTKFSVTGPMTGPSGATWDITSVWGIDPTGLIRLITATP